MINKHQIVEQLNTEFNNQIINDNKKMISEKINALIMEAIKGGNKNKINAYKNLKAKILEYKTAKNAKPLDSNAEITILNKMIKELQEDYNTYSKAGRIEMATEAAEQKLWLEEFVPKAATLVEVRDAIEKYAAENGEFTQKQMGLVVKYVKGQFENVDGKMVADEIKNYLSGWNNG